MLLGWGLGGLAGNLAAGYLSRWLRWAATAGPAILAIALAALAGTQGSALLAIAVVMWGFGFSMVPVTTQLWVSAIEPRRVRISRGNLQVTAFQIAIMSGSVVGGVLVDQQGPPAAMLMGAVAAVLATIGFASLRIIPRVS